MKTPEEILENNCPVFSALFLDKKNKAQMHMRDRILKAMEQYAIQCVETASFSSERLQEITESKLTEIQEAYELEQEHNISLVEELDDLKAHLKHVVSHYKGILKNDEFNCPACFKDIKSCECKQQQEEHAKNFGGI